MPLLLTHRTVPIFLAMIFVGQLCGADAASSQQDVMKRLTEDKTYVDVSNIQNVRVNLKYASEDNFMRRNVYGEFHSCLLHDFAAQKFRAATEFLQEERPGWKFVIFDCLRPRSLQEKLFAVVKGTPRQPYVADPHSGSLHNYGLAIDLSIEDQSGHELDIGTAFDDFSPLSRPDKEQQSLEAGKLTIDQLQNRFVLRKIMLKAGFIQLPIEWWHYDALPKEQVKAHYKIVE
jgi:D-alanyl-D-alanine dipeptidase